MQKGNDLKVRVVGKSAQQLKAFAQRTKVLPAIFEQQLTQHPTSLFTYSPPSPARESLNTHQCAKKAKGRSTPENGTPFPALKLQSDSHNH